MCLLIFFRDVRQPFNPPPHSIPLSPPPAVSQKTPAAPPFPLPGLALGPLLACFGAFGGNLLACLAVGTRSMVLAEETVWPASVAAWVLVGGRCVHSVCLVFERSGQSVGPVDAVRVWCF